MKKQIIYIYLIAISLLLISTEVSANKVFVLYGFKIGQSSSNPLKKFGKPFKSHKFEDGFSYNAFKIGDHFAVFTSDNTRPDLIWGIQIQGKSNPTSLGLNGINLGDPISKAVKLFGKPDRITGSTDEVTKEKMKGIEYYSYTESRNFSIESTNDVITSIKITFNGPDETKPSDLDFANFVSTVRSNDISKISELLSSDFILNKKKTLKLLTSINDALVSPGEIQDAFFHKDFGISTIQEKDIVNSAARFMTNPSIVGYVYFIKKANVEYELFFMKSFEGWVLKSIIFNK